MIVTFPHFGNSSFALKAIFDGLGIKYEMPNSSNKELLQIGSNFSPDEICFPFKIMLGDFIKSIEKGADTIIMVGSCGPCRFGEYCEIQRIILNKLNYKVKLIVLDNPSEIGASEFLKRIGEISKNSKVNKRKKINVLKNAYSILTLIDKIDSELMYLAGYEKNKGECGKLLKECKLEALKCRDDEEMLRLLKKYRANIKNIEIDKNKNPIKIALIGEIYTLMEPFSNMYIEDKLMSFGVSTKKYLSASWWISNALLGVLKLNSIDIRKASKEYMPYYIGGFAKECIGEAIISQEKGFDGAIQIFPLGCMPEIVSKAVLEKVSKDKNFPIMSLVMDEMTGEAGYLTRIEAFVDLLERRQEYKSVSHGS